jgi:hypothetical protein
MTTSLSDQSSVDGAVIVAKIDSLLQSSSSAEAKLVAVVLLTRLTCSLAMQDVVNRHPDLLPFIASSTKQLWRHQHEVFPRLFCQVVSRLSMDASSSSSSLENALLLLQEILSNRLDEPLANLDVDVLLALEHCLDALRLDPHNLHQQQQQASSVMELIWNRFDRVLISKTVPTPIAPIPKETSENNYSNTADWQMMIQTLEAVLHTTEELDLILPFQTVVITIWQRHGPWSCSQQPCAVSWYLPLLGSTSAVLRTTEWHAILLTCTQQLTKIPTDAFKPLWILILAYIGSHHDDSNMRLLSWTTAAHLIDTMGWDWMAFRNETNIGGASAALGLQKHPCTVIRLASGEWRLQLTNMCLEPKHESPLLDPCGRVIVAAFEYLLQQPHQMSPDALLHVRHSFQDVHHATVSYWTTTMTTTVTRIASTATTARVLGCLLTEFSMWDLSPEEATELLQATRVVFVAGVPPSLLLPPDVLPVLVAIMDSAHEDCHVEALVVSGILEQACWVNYLTEFWTRPELTNVEHSILWACQASDLWYAMASPSPKVALPLAKAVLRWIELAEFSSVLSAAIGAYVVLMGEKIPSQRDASIIEQALKLCAIHEGCSA